MSSFERQQNIKAEDHRHLVTKATFRPLVLKVLHRYRGNNEAKSLLLTTRNASDCKKMVSANKIYERQGSSAFN